MTVHIVTIGDEILIGQIIDTNSAWMAQQLNLIGAQITQITTVADSHDAIVASIKNGFADADVVLMTGGLGPTKDDITKKAIADFFQVKMSFHKESFENLAAIFKRFNSAINESHRIQSFIPDNALVLKNMLGTAPGMWFEHGKKVLVAMPGVPHEMKWIMQDSVLGKLSKHFHAAPIVHKTILTVGIGETRLAELIADFEDNLPDHIKLAYLPDIGQVRLRLTARGIDKKSLNKELESQKEQILKHISKYVYGFEEDSLEAAVGKLLIKKGWHLGTAESCTGGYLAHRITSVAGSSAYFWGSVIAYDNSVKINRLGVKAHTLEKDGAVSEATVKEMVSGAIEALGVDIAIATSGIMGPGGGTPEKPVGTVWIAVGNKDKISTHKLSLGKERITNIKYTTTFALNFLRKLLLH